MNAMLLFHAFIRAIKAKLKLQIELVKKCPFGSNDPNEIKEIALEYRNIHTISTYYNAFKRGYDPDEYFIYNIFEFPERKHRSLWRHHVRHCLPVWLRQNYL